MNYSYRDELYHHGILGQKWGKRNGPPYPLDPADHSASERKAIGKADSDRVAKIEKGKKIAKRVLLVSGAIGVVGLAAYMTASGGGNIKADIYDPEIMKLANSLEGRPYGGKLVEKHWDKNGRLILPPKEYKIVMREIKTHKDTRYKNKKMYPHYSAYGGGVYIVRKGKFKDPEIIDWFFTKEEAEDIWKELF